MSDWFTQATELGGNEPVYVNPLKKYARGAGEWVKKNPLDAAALAFSPVPVLGDIAGAANDIRHFATEPESRTWGNAGLSLLGLAPGVPPVMGMVKKSKDPIGDPELIKRLMSKDEPKLAVDNTRTSANANLSPDDQRLVDKARKMRVFDHDGNPVESNGLKNMTDEQIRDAMQPVSLKSVFGSQEMNDLDGFVNFKEKPSYLQDIDNMTPEITAKDIPAVEQAIGYKLNTYRIGDVIKRSKSGEIYPQGDLIHDALKNDDQTFILWDPDSGNRYLVDRTGAQSYIRMWTKIGD